eukprot:CAMPEP_0113931482 /NCGR_PEP_ID=MMETSP1159-20121227/6569_1 /TAXON_ID=88271 /ORGANISM="Picocystis salinarum" /LENGTH=96 /DNA_ID=CAMNT_0000932459 /DNA_START=548 /DNA_END=838 /DNA_ORIENTATION=- /assembly_acc=CAM_ASM_000767
MRAAWLQSPTAPFRTTVGNISLVYRKALLNAPVTKNFPMIAPTILTVPVERAHTKHPAAAPSSAVTKVGRRPRWSTVKAAVRVEGTSMMLCKKKLM